MIEEIKIMSRNGSNIFAGRVELDKAEVTYADQDVLFAGFISAILSVSEELQSSNIKEIGYQDNKIIFTLTENLIFLGLSSQKVPNDDIQSLLNNIVERWMKKFEDQEYPYVSDEMTIKIENLVNEAILDEFWWTKPEYTLENNVKLLTNSYRSPGGVYYFSYLPNIYILTAFILFSVTVLSSFIFRNGFSGFATSAPSNRFAALWITTISSTFIWLGVPAIMKLLNWEEFDYKHFVLLSGVYFPFIFILIIFGGGLYLSGPFDFLLGLSGSEVYKFFIVILFFFGPFNIGIFGFLIFLAYGGSYLTNLNSTRYYASFIFSFFIVISITESLVGTLETFLIS